MRDLDRYIVPAVAPASAAPLRGIAPYRDGERAALTGRDGEIDELVRAIMQRQLPRRPGVRRARGRQDLAADAAVEPALREPG
jgi:hypothetical protein